MAAKEATTMTVQDMGRMLGLKKTDSYYLLHKHCFETVTIAGKLRVVKASFEEWYANQDRYKKVKGPEPGSKLKAESLSFADIANMLAISKDSAREIIEKKELPTFWQDQKIRVSRDAFDRWYASQNHYRNAADREKDKAATESSITVPEMGRLLGLDRREAWKLYYAAKSELVLIRVADRPRITKRSFEKWLNSQTDYRIVPVPDKAPVKKPAQKQPIDLTKEYFSIVDAASILNMDERDLYRMVSYKEINGKKVGRHWFISNADLHNMLCMK